METIYDITWSSWPRRLIVIMTGAAAVGLAYFGIQATTAPQSTNALEQNNELTPAAEASTQVPPTIITNNIRQSVPINEVCLPLEKYEIKGGQTIENKERFFPSEQNLKANGLTLEGLSRLNVTRQTNDEGGGR